MGGNVLRGWRRLVAIGLSVSALLGFEAALAQTPSQVIYGPVSVKLPSSSLFSFSDSFSVPASATGPYLLRVQLSAPNSLTTLSFKLNNVQVLSLADFSGGKTQVDRTVSLNAKNSFSLQVAGKTNTVITITVMSAPAVSVSIASPVGGAVIASNLVAVSGTFVGPSGTCVSVNGFVAALVGNNFYASNISLQSGSNAIGATAVAVNGQTATQTLSVTSTGPAPIQVVATQPQGLAPLSVVFSVINRTSNAIQRLDADYLGNGAVSSTTDPTGLNFTYSAPGVYEARFIVTDSQGRSYDSTQVVVAQDVAGVNTLLSCTYARMLAKLRAGDIDGALAHFTASASDKYRGVFTALQPNLATTVDQLGTIQDATIGKDFAEYVIVRNSTSGPKAFLMYFIRSEDGIWRIDGM